MAWIWKDQFDKDNFHIGVYSEKYGYSIWVTIFCDAIRELFGEDTYSWAKDLPSGIPTKISLTMKES